MFKTILRYVFIGIIVYFLDDFFNSFLHIPTDGMVDGFLKLENTSDAKLLYIMRFIVWMFVTDLAIRYTRPLFGFAMPTARRYSVTKPFRRIQGVFAEVFMFGANYFVCILIFSIISFPIMFFIKLNDWHEIILSDGETELSQTQKNLANDLVWNSLKDEPLNFIEPAHKKFLIIIFIVALVIYIIGRVDGRQGFAKSYEGLLRILEQSRFGLGGSARFAGLIEEWSTNFKGQKNALFLGKSLYSPRLTIGSEDPRHMMTIAGSRAGKGTTAIIPNLLLWKGSALVVDPKGTNAAVTERRRKKMGQNVYLVDPFNIVNNNETDAFNPLSVLDPNAPDIREQINIIAEALVVPDPEPKEKHWDDGAKTIIAGLIGHIISSDKFENPTLPMIRELLSLPPDDQKELWIDMMLNKGAGRLPIDTASRVLRGVGTSEMSSILSNADKHTEWLSSPAIQKAINSSTFNFAELKEKSTTVYLILPPNLLETHNRFLRLFINLSLGQMSVGGRSKVPVLMIMDEFLALGRMQEVEKAFGLLAGYNLIMWPFIQDLGRLRDIYKNSVNAFINNSRAVQVFGVFDGETTKFISERLGDRTLDGYTRTATNNKAVKMRTPSEIALDISTESNRQYVLRAGKAPLLLEKVPYYEPPQSKYLYEAISSKWFKARFEGMYDQDPDYK